MFIFVIAIGREVFDSHKIYRSIIFADYLIGLTPKISSRIHPPWYCLFKGWILETGFGACLDKLG